MRFTIILVMLLLGMHIFTIDAVEKNSAGDPAFVDLVINVKKDTKIDSQMQTVRIHYRVNHTEIERDYMHNAKALDLLDRVFTTHRVEQIAYIVITGSASPEGSSQHNEWLAEQRASSLKQYILTNYPGLHDDQLVTIPRGEDWEGLEAMIKEDDKVPHREELLRILRSELSREEKKRAMATLAQGQPYRYLQEQILPRLRGGVSGTVYFRENLVQLVDTIEILRVDTLYREKIVYVPQETIVYLPQEHTTPPTPPHKPWVIALKNNLLYDLALLPNLSVELPFGRDYRWSALAEGNWSWWNSGDDHYTYHRIQMAGVELRYWFGNNGMPLKGWFAGLYGYGGDYDLRLFADKKSDRGEQSRWSYSAGLTAGYTLPLKGNFNLEFSLGIGYLGGEYKRYNVSECREGQFPIVGSYDRSYFGVTKGAVSLVWVIGKGKRHHQEKEESP